MAIRNVNTIQNPEDLAYFVQNYTIESLSNLGQRFSIKGDGITTLSFDVARLFNLDTSLYEKPISKMYTDGDHVYISVYDSIYNYNSNEPIYTDELLYTKDSTIITDTPFKLGIRINAVDEYDANAILYKTSSDFVYTTLGMDLEKGNVELNVGRYDKDSNIILEYIKIVDYALSIDGVIYYPLCYLVKSDTDNYTYYASVAVVKSDTLNKYGSFSDALEYYYNNYIVEYYKETHNINLSDLFAEFLQNDFNGELLIDNEEISYNKNEYSGLYYFTSVAISAEINGILNLINNDEDYLYPFLIDYYCNYVYKYDNNQLHKLILYSIYTEAENEVKRDSNVDVIKDFELFIPLDYTFNYYCNDSDKYLIYTNQTPISLYFIQRSKQINTVYLDENYDYLVGTLFTTTRGNDKLNLYNFTCNYNSKNEKIINSITTNKLYTTPYIINDFWAINNIQTNFRAVGRDAGNPNIIIMYVDDFSGIINKYNGSNLNNVGINLNKDITVKFLTATNKQELEKLPLTITSFSSDILGKFITNSSSIKGYTVIPNLNAVNSDVIEMFRNSIIINLTHINNFGNTNTDTKQKIIKYYGNKSYVTTLWTCVDDGFTMIKSPMSSNDALTLSEIENLNNIVTSTVQDRIEKYSVPADHYNFTYLVFDDAGRVPKNNSMSYYYPALYNSYDMFASNSSSNDISNGTATLSSGHLTIEYVNSFDKTNETCRSIPFKWLDNYMNRTDKDAVNIFDYISAYEYIPNTFMPFFNLADVLVENQFLANRSNLFTFGSGHNIYYSYLGASIYDKDKSVLHLGTNEICPTGYLSKSLFSGSTEFQPIKEVDIDIENTIVNSTTVINNAQYTKNKGIAVNKYGNDSLQSVTVKYIYGVAENVLTVSDIDNSSIKITGGIKNIQHYSINIGPNKFNCISLYQLFDWISDNAVKFDYITDNNTVVVNLPSFNVYKLGTTEIIDKYVILTPNQIGNKYITDITVNKFGNTVYIESNDYNTPLFNKDIKYTEI